MHFLLRFLKFTWRINSPYIYSSIISPFIVEQVLGFFVDHQKVNKVNFVVTKIGVKIERVQ
jgi:hypothetical protein